MNETPFHLQLIREVLSKRQRVNPAYSLRAYGRDLGLDPSTLSQVIKGKRPLPIKNFDRVMKTLKLTPIERMKFMESGLKKRALLDQIQTKDSQDQFLLDESQYRVIAEWEHYAVFTLCDLADFKLTAETAAQKLGITRLRAEAVIQNLINSKILKVAEKGTFQKASIALRTTEDISSQALVDSHLEALELAKKKIESVPVELRDFSSMNLAFDPDQLVELKAIIREFRKKVSTMAKSGKKKREVYQLAIQLYPLSKIEKQEKHT